MHGELFRCRSDVFHSAHIVYRDFFIRWQSVILLKSRPVAFSTGDFVISLEIVDKGWIFWSGVKLGGISESSRRTWIDFISIVLFITEANVIDYYSSSSIRLIRIGSAAAFLLIGFLYMLSYFWECNLYGKWLIGSSLHSFVLKATVTKSSSKHERDTWIQSHTH